METKVIEYFNPDFGNVRTLKEGATVLYCGADIAKALGYAKPQKAVADHCKGALKRSTPTNGGEQDMLFIPEGDVYRLTASSKLPGAQKFEHWLFDITAPKAVREEIAKPSCIEDVMIASLQEMKAVKARLDAQEQQLSDMRQIVGMSSATWREDAYAIVRNISKARGGFDFYRITNFEIYEELEHRAGVDLERRLENKKKRAREQGVAFSNVARMNKVDAIGDDKRLTEIYAAIVKEFAVRYGVSRTVGSIDIEVG